jgi:CheY-like chemotaxis protein
MSQPDERSSTSSPSAAPAATDPGKLRILAVDDSGRILRYIEEVVREVGGDSVELFTAQNEAEALKIFDNHYLDIILLDFKFGDNRLGGYSILQYLDQLGCSGEVILMTKLDLGDEADRVVQSISRLDRPRVMDYLKKQEFQSLLPATITRLIERFETTRVNLTNLDLAVQLLSRRRNRYSKPPLRESDDEVGVEVERICRDLFGSVNGRPFGHIGGRPKSTDVSVDLQRLERRGLSAAVTLKPVVQLGFADVPDRSQGYDCVLKLGPIEDVREELARYREYVRYGVKLEQRVELLGSAFRDAIGGIVYSFAGGVFGQALLSLDELLRQNSELSSKVVENLFAAGRWYSVSAGRRPVARYMESPYRVDLGESTKRNLANLRKMQRKHHREISVDVGQHGADSSFRIGEGPQLKIPGNEFLGEGWHVDAHPWCLVHGDMHGGNVMVELSNTIRGGNLDLSTKGRTSVRRVCLIDYRNSGPGPRCIDATALESSVRMADAETIASQFGPDGASFLEGQALLGAMMVASRRVDKEQQVYRHLWGQRDRALDDDWAIIACNVVRGLFKRFEEQPVSLEEYLQTAMLYAIRQLGYQMDGVSRVRINAWLAALYILFRKIHSAE